MKNRVKGLLAAGLMALLVVLAGTNALAAEESGYAIFVNGKELDLSDLPRGAYLEGDTLMVPLRKIGEALGYTVGWDAETGAITLDDEYIQKATFFEDSAQVTFEGWLKVINMSREIELSVPATVHNGRTYVPVEFFEEFFNDVGVEGNTVTIAPSMAELCA